MSRTLDVIFISWGNSCRSQMTEGRGEEARSAIYRRVRDEIRTYAAQLPELLGCADPAGPRATA